MSLVYLNGEYLDLADAKVSPLDRGFLFGDSVYEVIPFYQGKGLGLDAHLKRLQESLNAIEIDYKVDTNEWQSIFNTLLDSKDGDHKVYLQITRGTALERSFEYPNPAVKPTVFVFSKPFHRGRLTKGIKCITIEDIRWRDCYIKSNNLLPSCMATEVAARHNTDEAIMHRHNELTEGASSNVFVVKDGSVLTTPANGHILNGITRQFVLQILRENDIPHAEVNVPIHRITDADEIWITSSTREIAPVIECDGKVIGSGKPGPVWQKVFEHFSKLYA